MQLANEVLESDDLVDHYRDLILGTLLAGMSEDASRVAPNFEFVLATRYLERIADHATNIAEDLVFWVQGLDIRHAHTLPLSDSDGQDVHEKDPQTATRTIEAGASRRPS